MARAFFLPCCDRHMGQMQPWSEGHGLKWDFSFGDTIEEWRHSGLSSALIVSGHQAGAVVKAGWEEGQWWAHWLCFLGNDQMLKEGQP